MSGAGVGGAGPGGPGLPRLYGHDDLLERVRVAVRSGRLPQSLLLHGPPGVGKRTMALWVAALLACDGDDRPCGECRSCRLARRLEHPDLHLHFPMPRPKRAGSPAKLREAIETQRQERLAHVRETGMLPREDAATGIYLAAVESIRQQAARRPAMGDKAVFIVADADMMVPQAASPEAANAFLKLLEEPPGFAHVVLTSSRPEALLPTIRSRTASLRLPPIAETLVARCLAETRGCTAETADGAARRADGSVGRAVRLLGETDDAAARTANRLLRAALRADPATRYGVASSFTASGGRAILEPALEALSESLRDLLCRTTGAEGRIRDPEGIAGVAQTPDMSTDALLRALGALDEALDGARKNLNPQSTVSVLLAEMGGALAPDAGR